MTGSPQAQAGQAHWDVLGAAVPTALEDGRVLHVGSGDDGDASLAALGDRGADLVRWKPPGEQPVTGAPFKFVYCAGALQLDPHPMKLLSDIWHATETGGVLLLESQIEPELKLSRFGRFAIDAEAGRSYWVPGRLALRWLVETSGFDVEGWLGNPIVPAGQSSTASAYLKALRSDRMPALDLAIPG